MAQSKAARPATVRPQETILRLFMGQAAWSAVAASALPGRQMKEMFGSNGLDFFQFLLAYEFISDADKRVSSPTTTAELMKLPIPDALVARTNTPAKWCL